MGEISSRYESDSVECYDGDSDDAIKKDKYQKYDPSKMKVDYQWEVGLEFTSIT